MALWPLSTMSGSGAERSPHAADTQEDRAEVEVLNAMVTPSPTNPNNPNSLTSLLGVRYPRSSNLVERALSGAFGFSRYVMTIAKASASPQPAQRRVNVLHGFEGSRAPIGPALKPRKGMGAPSTFHGVDFDRQKWVLQ